MKVREQHHIIRNAKKAARREAAEATKSIDKMYIFLTTAKTLLKGDVPQHLIPLQRLADGIDPLEVREVFRYALRDKIRERVEKALEDYKQGDGKGSRLLDVESKS